MINRQYIPRAALIEFLTNEEFAEACEKIRDKGNWTFALYERGGIGSVLVVDLDYTGAGTGYMIVTGPLVELKRQIRYIQKQ